MLGSEIVNVSTYAAQPVHRARIPRQSPTPTLTPIWNFDNCQEPVLHRCWPVDQRTAEGKERKGGKGESLPEQDQHESSHPVDMQLARHLAFTPRATPLSEHRLASTCSSRLSVLADCSPSGLPSRSPISHLRLPRLSNAPLLVEPQQTPKSRSGVCGEERVPRPSPNRVLFVSSTTGLAWPGLAVPPACAASRASLHSRHHPPPDAQHHEPRSRNLWLSRPLPQPAKNICKRISRLFRDPFHHSVPASVPTLATHPHVMPGIMPRGRPQPGEKGAPAASPRTPSSQTGNMPREDPDLCNSTIATEPRML
ncbi:hypothetical protein CMUS01_06935 [Colletotrichum musicola]|uniref:Uncharacterized protein n=1 Tax=Colletotrichum musicola TaxID=2175873 RepID=A0A8H6KJ13_9PEZI|nr:hypothetical protein CMUS01_06935 [Colletotrichum musicola]